MPDKQSELCREVLVRMRDAGLLGELLLVGSWCLPAYQAYFGESGKVRTLRTRDLDFLVPLPTKIRRKVDMEELLADLGFVTGHRGDEGAAILQHPELMVEFLVVDRGRNAGRVVNLPALGLNAQSLRFMNAALMQIIELELHGVEVRLPHPACFALHKLLIAPRRREASRRSRDAESGVHLLELLAEKGEAVTVQTLFGRFPRPWRRRILDELREAGRLDIGERLGLKA